MIFVTDLLVPPYDEGAKVVAVNVIKELSLLFDKKFVVLNGSFFNWSIFKMKDVRVSRYIIYLPSQSNTVFSIVRCAIMRMITGKKGIFLATQVREYKCWQKYLVRMIQPNIIFVQSSDAKKKLMDVGIENVYVNSWGVDLDKFKKASPEYKRKLRNKYGIPDERIVYLHFGHLKKRRNLAELEPVIKASKINYVLVVCSTTTKQDDVLKGELERKGYHFITEYIRDNQELYQLADYYVFPTVDALSAIEFPLSVFEALACGIPVFHKNFGALKDIFSGAYSDVRNYADSSELCCPQFSNEAPFPIQNYSWSKVISKMLKDAGIENA